MASRVIIYTTPTCGYCAAVKRYLKNHRIPIREIDVSRDPRAAAEMKRKSGGTAVPVIDAGGRIIVGFDKRGLNAALGIKD
jgi:glutaredoxin 3